MKPCKIQELLAMHYDERRIIVQAIWLLAFGKVLGEVKHATNIIHTGH